MKKILDLSSWRTALGNLLPSAHGHQGGSRKAIGSMLIVAFAVVGCDDSSSASAGQNDEPAVESSSSSSGKVTEPAEVTSSSSSETKSSSSSAVTSSSSSKGPELAEESFTDTRDGQTYKTVTVGTQTWMAENLNYETANSYCYNDNSANCTKYGRLYTWGAAKTACPSGWHLPDTTEWKALFTAVGGSSTAGTKLKSTSAWNNSGNGTDAFGFSALPAGGRDSYGDYYYEGYYADFWSSTEDGSDSTEDGSDCAYFMRLYYSYDYADLNNNYKYYGFSVRCVKD